MSLGYGKKHRLYGEIVWSFKEEHLNSVAFLKIYGSESPAWCMEIKLDEFGNEDELKRQSRNKEE